MNTIALVDKKAGQTPLEALETYRVCNRIPPDVPMTYAGRLDPMASGALLLLIGDACRTRDAYTTLAKEYEFQILFGVQSDTGDVLGIVDGGPVIFEESDLRRIDMRGTHNLPYPAYASKTVGGIPLFMYAREGRLHEIAIPTREMIVRSFEYLGFEELESAELKSRACAKIGALAPHLDFRQEDARRSWHSIVDGTYRLAKYRAAVESGTYIRSIAAEIGRRLHVPALAFSIRRTRFIGLSDASFRTFGTGSPSA